MNETFPFLRTFWAGAEKIYGQISPDINKLISLIKDFQKESLVEEICLIINELNTNPEDTGINQIKRYLNRNQKKTIDKTYGIEEDGVYLLYKNQLYTALKIILLKTEGEEILNERNKSKFGQFLLTISYLRNNVEINKATSFIDSDENLYSLISSTLPSFPLAEIDTTSKIFNFQSIGREYYNYVKYFELHCDDTRFEVFKEDFESIVGYSLVDYYSLAFGLISNVSRTDNNIEIDNSVFFQNLPQQDLVQYLQNRISKNINYYKNEPIWAKDLSDEKNILNPTFLPILKYPICNLNSKSIFIDRIAVTQKAIDDIYWIFENHYLETSDERKRRLLSSTFGDIFQSYVEEQLKNNLTPIVDSLDDMLELQGKKKADFKIETDTSILLIECKHFRYSLATDCGDLSTFKTDTEKILGNKNGVIQIDKTIEALGLESKNKKIYRILITNERIPENFFFFKYYEEISEHWSTNKENISYAIIIHKDEFERLITIGLQNFILLLEKRDIQLRTKDAKGYVMDKNALNLLQTFLDDKDLSKNESKNKYTESLVEEYIKYVRGFLLP